MKTNYTTRHAVKHSRISKLQKKHLITVPLILSLIGGGTSALLIDEHKGTPAHATVKVPDRAFDNQASRSDSRASLTDSLKEKDKMLNSTTLKELTLSEEKEISKEVREQLKNKKAKEAKEKAKKKALEKKKLELAKKKKAQAEALKKKKVADKAAADQAKLEEAAKQVKSGPPPSNTPNVAQSPVTNKTTKPVVTDPELNTPALRCEVFSGNEGLQEWPGKVRSRIQAQFGINNIGGMRPGDPQDHGKGLALDVMITGPKGTEITQWAIKHANVLNIDYIIWEQKIYASWTGWAGRMMDDRGSITQNHYDHVHISFKPGIGTCPGL